MIKPYLTYEPYGKEFIVCGAQPKVSMYVRNRGIFIVSRLDQPRWQRCVYSAQQGLDIMRSIVGDFTIPAGVAPAITRSQGV